MRCRMLSLPKVRAAYINEEWWLCFEMLYLLEGMFVEVLLMYPSLDMFWRWGHAAKISLAYIAFVLWAELCYALGRDAMFWIECLFLLSECLLAVDSDDFFGFCYVLEGYWWSCYSTFLWSSFWSGLLCIGAFLSCNMLIWKLVGYGYLVLFSGVTFCY